LKQHIAATLSAIYDYADKHPGVIRAAMTDSRVIDADGAESLSLLMQWGVGWTALLREGMEEGSLSAGLDADIIGQAIAGALYQAGRESQRIGQSRDALVSNLTDFLTRALKPD